MGVTIHGIPDAAGRQPIQERVVQDRGPGPGQHGHQLVLGQGRHRRGRGRSGLHRRGQDRWARRRRPVLCDGREARPVVSTAAGARDPSDRRAGGRPGVERRPRRLYHSPPRATDPLRAGAGLWRQGVSREHAAFPGRVPGLSRPGDRG